ncbi:hypothetical protein J2Y40_003157 [Chryseobacterium sp. 2987]|nr:hypothetical protein [Chryseobacterium sp. 2987]
MVNFSETKENHSFTNNYHKVFFHELLLQKGEYLPFEFCIWYIFKCSRISGFISSSIDVLKISSIH